MQLGRITQTSANSRIWLDAEFMYPTIDRGFFAYNEFAAMLRVRGVTHERMRRHDWVRLRRTMGRPRRFSKAFVQQERNRLQRFRGIVRDAQVGEVRFLLAGVASYTFVSIPY